MVNVRSHDREERQVNLNLKIYMVNNTSQGHHSSVLHLEISDEMNP